MDDPLNSLKQLWKAEKAKHSAKTPSVEVLISRARQKQWKTLQLRLTSSGILTLTALMLMLFFTYVTPVRNALSHVGVLLMIGGLLLRIGLELYSIYRAYRIDVGASTVEHHEAYFRFYTYRKKIQGPITLSILVLYSLGFYLLTPEFSQHLSPKALRWMHCTYLVGAIIVGFFIRKGIRDEMTLLREILHIQKEIYDNTPITQ